MAVSCCVCKRKAGDCSDAKREFFVQFHKSMQPFHLPVGFCMYQVCLRFCAPLSQWFVTVSCPGLNDDLIYCK